MLGQSVPNIWPLKSTVFCGYASCPEYARWGVGYHRPVRKFCKHHLLVIQWGWLIDDDINYPAGK